MRKREKEILIALGEINEKYLDQAKPRGRKKHRFGIFATAACFVIIIGTAFAMTLFGSTGGGGGIAGDNSSDNGYGGDRNNSVSSEDQLYSPEKTFPEVPKPSKSLAAVIEDYLQSNYESDGGLEGVEGDVSADYDDSESNGSSDSNGSYVEVTDNQVEGIIEGDLYKTTDKYIFRYRNNSLHIYSIDGESSAGISVTPIGSNGQKSYADMFLSEDGNTVTIIQSEYVYSNYDDSIYSIYYYIITRVYSIDVSDVYNPSITKTLEIYGSNKAVRKIGGKIYLVTSRSFNKDDIDVDAPASYIPGISGDEMHICDLETIYYPYEITSVSYYYITVFNEADLSLSAEYAILSDKASFMTGVYFTDNHIAIEHQSGRKIGEEDGYPISEAYSAVDLIDFSGDELRYRGQLEMNGWAESGRFSYDEQDGYLRVVVSTRTRKRYWIEKSNASLYVYDLSTMSLAASVENFAPEGERATAVRFEGDKLYVCTAETVQFIDPVFCFDLSDYDNITQVNTGYIEGFSTSLIDIGEGYLVGIGRESRTYTKIEVYKRDGESVISVAEYVLRGNYDNDYHAYLIDRENNLIGLALTGIYEGYGVSYGHGYFLWHFNPETENLSLVIDVSGSDMHTSFSYARAFVRDGYLYLTSTNEFTELVVRKVELD